MHYGFFPGGYVEWAPRFRRHVPTGRWVKFGLWIDLGTLGASDGFMRGYMDDELVAELTGVNMRPSGDPRGFHAFWWGGTVSFLPGQVAAHDSRRWMDDFKFYDTKPLIEE